MQIGKFCESDRSDLIKLWQVCFPNDSAHNQAARVIDAKLAVDDII